MAELRRSERLGAYDSNGRDYLSSRLGWTRPKFEDWIHSPTVRPFLQEWHALCIVGHYHFNDAVDWINTGEKGYFYNENDLEEDLLFICLCAGDDGQAEDQGEGSSINLNANGGCTAAWLTQELWARTAWRVVHANRSPGQIFHFAMQDRPAVAYGFAVEMLCIIFHSIAFRGVESVYLPLIEGGQVKVAGKGAQSSNAETSNPSKQFTIDGAILDDLSSSSSGDVDRISDATFPSDGEKQLATSELSTIILADASKDAPRGEDYVASEIKVKQPNNANSSTSPSVVTAGRSSVHSADRPEPLTPGTGTDLRDRVVFVGEEVSKDDKVREWLEKSKLGRAKPFEQ